MRPGGATDDLPWTCPEDFTLETVVPDGKGGLYLVAADRTLHLEKGAKKPVAFAAVGSAAGAAWLGKTGLLLGHGTHVRRVDARGKVAVVAKGFGDVYGVAEDARGRLHVSDWKRGEVVRVEGTKRTVIAKGLSYPSGLAFDAQGRLYVKESGRMTGRDMTIRRIDGDGKVTLFATVPSMSRWHDKPEAREDAKGKER